VPLAFFLRGEYKYTYPSETPQGKVLPVFMADFTEELYYGLNHVYNEEETKRHIKNLLWTIDYMVREAKNNKKLDQKFDQKREEK
jgi:hypothetical protein